MTPAPTPDTSALEADIAARRDRLARTVDELAERATPQAIVARQKAAAKQRLTDAAMTPEGDLRVERVGAVVAIVGALVVLAIVKKKRG